MSDQDPITVSELLGKAFAGGYITDREMLDDFVSFDFDEALDNVSSLIVQSGDDLEAVLRDWNVID